MARTETTIRDLPKSPISIETGDVHTIVVATLEGHSVEMADAHFNLDSAVLLPDQGLAAFEGKESEKQITALAVLRACYVHAKQNADQRAVIAGHTDTAGKPGYNLTLSQLRAENVRAALLGDKDKWVELSLARNVVADHQRILRFVALTLGWDCEPGPIDNENGPQTRRAVRGFQTRYNQEFEASITVDGVVGKQVWGAFFDVYMLELKELLSVDDAGLAEQQKLIKFADSAHEAVGCGEHHPVAAPGVDDLRNVENRRVQILFFEPGHEPKFPCHPSKQQCRPELCEIYRGHFTIQPVPVEILLSGQQLLLEWPDSLTADLPTDLQLVVIQHERAEVVRPWSSGDVIEEHRRFKFEPFNPALVCTLLARSAGTETVLWNEQRVNNPTNPPQWEHTLEELLLNPPDDAALEATGDLPPDDQLNNGDIISI